MNCSQDPHYIQLLFPAWTLLAVLPPSPIHSYQPGLPLACASLGLSLAVSRSLDIGSHSSASRRSGSRVLFAVGLLLFSSASNCVLERTMASVCIIGSGNWWVRKKRERVFDRREYISREYVDARDGWQNRFARALAHMQTSAHICLHVRVLRFIVCVRADDKVFCTTKCRRKSLVCTINNWRYAIFTEITITINYEYY